MLAIFSYVSSDIGCEYVGLSSGDCVLMTENIVEVLDIYAKVSRGQGFQGHVHRRNVPASDASNRSKFRAGNLRYLVNYPGADTFFWTKEVFEELVNDAKPINILTWGLERFLWKWSFRNDKHHTFDMTNNVEVFHIDHKKREGNESMDGLPYEVTDDPGIAYNRELNPTPMLEIWKGMKPFFWELDNGMIVKEIRRTL